MDIEELRRCHNEVRPQSDFEAGRSVRQPLSHLLEVGPEELSPRGQTGSS